MITRQLGRHIGPSTALASAVTYLQDFRSHLRVGKDLLGRVPLKQLDPLVPLGHVVGVLPEHDAVEQLRTAGDEELQALEPEGAFEGMWALMWGHVGA